MVATVLADLLADRVRAARVARTRLAGFLLFFLGMGLLRTSVSILLIPSMACLDRSV